jgi:hypothetical protein
MEEEVMYQTLSVQEGEKFSCPFCNTEYVLELDSEHLADVARPLNGPPCEHLNPAIRPRGDGRRVVRFATPVEENAPLRQKIAYLLNSAGPFHAWLARKESWHLVGETGRGDKNPIARFLAESLGRGPHKVWAWVDRDASIFVSTESGERVFIPDLDKLWLHEFVWFIWERGRGKMWTAGEVIKLIELINRLSARW